MRDLVPTENRKIRKLLGYFPLWVGLGVTLGAALLNQPIPMILGALATLLILVRRVAVLTRRSNVLPHPSEISPLIRSEFRALQQHYLKLEKLIQDHSEWPIVKAVGQEALQEAEQLLAQVLRTLEQRLRLQKVSRDIEFQDNFKQNYATALAKVNKELSEAQQALQELEEKISSFVLEQHGASANNEELQQSILKLKSLSNSLHEATEIFEQKSYNP
jgi:hypothetical protein